MEDPQEGLASKQGPEAGTVAQTGAKAGAAGQREESTGCLVPACADLTPPLIRSVTLAVRQDATPIVTQSVALAPPLAEGRFEIHMGSSGGLRRRGGPPQYCGVTSDPVRGAMNGTCRGVGWLGFFKNAMIGLDLCPKGCLGLPANAQPRCLGFVMIKRAGGS